MSLYARPLSLSEQQWLDSLQQSADDNELARRARIVLLSARRLRVHEISLNVDLHPINVRKWIHRFNQYGLSGLSIRRSPGRPPIFCRGQRQAIVELATRTPQSLGLSFRAWTLQRLRSELVHRGVVEEISAETIRQELRRAGLVFEGRCWAPAHQLPGEAIEVTCH